MPFDIFNTHDLLMAVRELTPPTTFLKSRYFPTRKATDVFTTDDVLVEYKDGSKKLAPFVAPRKGGVTILRSGFNMKRFEPPHIAPRRTLTIDDLKKRGFGESLFAQLTPAQRELAMLMQDATELDEMITRREEAMSAETLLTNGCVMKHIADDVSVGDEMEIRFYDSANNPSMYTPAVKWGQNGCKIIDDIDAMAKMLKRKGLPVTELLVAADIVPIMINDPTIKELMDIRGYSMGGVDPEELPNGVTRVMRLNVYGKMIDILCYDEQYTADNGQAKYYIPEGTVILLAPSVGRGLYGAVSQVEQYDGRFHTYTGMRIPKYLSDPNSNTRTLTLSSSPLLIPNHLNSWITAKVTA